MESTVASGAAKAIENLDVLKEEKKKKPFKIMWSALKQCSVPVQDFCQKKKKILVPCNCIVRHKVYKVIFDDWQGCSGQMFK